MWTIRLPTWSLVLSKGLGELASKDEVAEGDLEATLAAKINGKADIGTAEDTSALDTVKGAKKYADEKATAAETNAKGLCGWSDWRSGCG